MRGDEPVDVHRASLDGAWISQANVVPVAAGASRYRVVVSVTVSTGIITPEAVVLEFRIAGLATRALAKVVDLAIQMMVLVMIVAGVAMGLGSIGSETPVVISLALSVFVIVVLAPALCETFWNGRTPGKALFGLRVVTVDGGPISFRHALVRGLLQLVELPLGIALLIALGNPRSQRLGDLAAGTFVISERSASSLTVPTLFQAPPGLEYYCAQLDVSRVDSEQFLLVRNFLLRVSEMEAAARYGLAVRLATSISQISTPTPPAGVPPELYLVCVCSAYQTRHGGPARLLG